MLACVHTTLSSIINPQMTCTCNLHSLQSTFIFILNIEKQENEDGGSLRPNYSPTLSWNLSNTELNLVHDMVYPGVEITQRLNMHMPLGNVYLYNNLIYRLIEIIDEPSLFDDCT